MVLIMWKTSQHDNVTFIMTDNLLNEFYYFVDIPYRSGLGCNVGDVCLKVRGPIFKKS